MGSGLRYKVQAGKKLNRCRKKHVEQKTYFGGGGGAAICAQLVLVPEGMGAGAGAAATGLAGVRAPGAEAGLAPIAPIGFCCGGFRAETTGSPAAAPVQPSEVVAAGSASVSAETVGAGSPSTLRASESIEGAATGVEMGWRPWSRIVWPNQHPVWSGSRSGKLPASVALTIRENDSAPSTTSTTATTTTHHAT